MKRPLAFLFAGALWILFTGFVSLELPFLPKEDLRFLAGRNRDVFLEAEKISLPPSSPLFYLEMRRRAERLLTSSA